MAAISDVRQGILFLEWFLFKSVQTMSPVSLIISGSDYCFVYHLWPVQDFRFSFIPLLLMFLKTKSIGASALCVKLYINTWYCFVHPTSHPALLLTYFSQITCLLELWSFVLRFWTSLKTGDFNITSSSLFCGFFFFCFK